MSTLELVGCDGSTWNLMGLGGSPVKMTEGIGGLHFSKVNHLWQTTARGSGATWKGSRMATRQFSFNVYFADVSYVPQFMAALSTDLTAQLVANGNRTLTFRLDEDNDITFTKDPGLGIGMDRVYPIHCVADRPEWTGPDVTATFTFAPTTTDNFFGSTGGLGPPFYISASNLFNTAMVANPGDLPAYPVWTITGPVTTATVGVGGDTVTIPWALADRDVVIIDTAAQSITDDQGNNLWPQMGYADVEFSAIPAGDQVPVTLGMDGAGTGASVSVSLTPLYRRAW